MIAAWLQSRSHGRSDAGPTLTTGEAAVPSLATAARPAWPQLALAGVLVFGLIVTAVLCTPIAATPLLPVPGFTTAFGTAMVVINLVLAALLLSKGSIENRADGVRLGAAYLFVALVVTVWLLSFNNVFVPGILIGKPGTSVWLWCFWHGGFAIMTAWYAGNVGRPSGAPSILIVIGIVVGLVFGLTILTTAGIDTLPGLMVNGQTFFTGSALYIPIGLLALNGAALLLCVRLQARTTEQLWVTVAMVAACLDVWLTVSGSNRFALGWYLAKCGSFITSIVVFISLLHDITKLYRSSAEANVRLEGLVHLDGLTGTYNRRHFDVTLKVEWGRAIRDGKPLSLLMLDVDFFKQFNDRYGHLAGDDCLRFVGQCLSQGVRRPADVVTRFGGEEFAILLPNTDQAGSLKVAEMLRASIEAAKIPHSRSPNGLLSVSTGASTLSPQRGSDPLVLVRLADEALYRSKSQGRNCVTAALAA